MSREKTKNHLRIQVRNLAIAIYIGCVILLIDTKYGNIINNDFKLWFKYIIGIYIISNRIIPFIITIFPKAFTIWGGIKAFILSIPIAFLFVKGIYPKWLKIQNK